MVDGTKNSDKGALDGIRVLDLTRVLAGPWASQLLADYGAEVIKVERPGRGDDTRSWGPPWLRDAAGDATTDSAYFLSANRNKRSITINLANPDGSRIARDLAVRSDVVLENYRVGTLQKYGLGYADLNRLNPALIYCSITAYGQTGSRADYPGYDAMIQASGGLMSITGMPDEEGGSPQKAGVAIADIMAGMYAATAVLAALVSRSQTGQGQEIDVPLYDSQVSWLANQNMNFLIGGEAPGRLGTAHPNLVPYQAFPTLDGHLMLAIGNDRQFVAFATCLGRPDLAVDERFLCNSDRVRNREALVRLIANEMVKRETGAWLAEMTAAGVPVGPINNIAEVFSEPYAAERELVKVLRHPAAGDLPSVANPVRFSETPVTYRRAPPLIGEHTQEILSRELGLSSQEIKLLAESGAI